MARLANGAPTRSTLQYPPTSILRLAAALLETSVKLQCLRREAGPAMREKITKRSVEALQPQRCDAFLWDTEIPGFGCKITPKGARIYVLQYGRFGRDHRVTLGRHGIDITAEQARLEARRLRGLVATGENPAASHARGSSAATVAELGERYMEEYAVPHKKPSGVAQDRRNLDNHVFPLLGRLLVRTVEREDIARAMRDVAAGKTAKDEKTKRQGRRIVRGGQIVANRMQALLSKMFELAEDWKLRPAASNPCRGAKRYAEHKMERFLSKEELSRLGAALLAAEQNNSNVGGNRAETLREGADGPKDQKAVRHRESQSAMAAIRLLLLTGCRVGEILNLQWSNVDLERRLLLLPDSKTGAKTVYLSAHARQLLTAISREPEHDYVLPGRLPKKPLLSLRKPWERLCKAAQIENVRLHDLRHSFASVGAAGGLSLPMIGALLGHSQPTTTARYAHLAASPIHQAADTIGAQLAAAMNSRDGDHPSPAEPP